MERQKRIVIVGGGTAGWMAANLMIRRWPDAQITLLESPDIGIIGVGEGSTPQLKAFFDGIDVSEAQWMPRGNATYKVGISFADWSRKPGFEHYFHPFPSQPDKQNHRAFVESCYWRRRGIDVEGHPDRFFLNAYLAQHRLGPKADRSFPFRVTYGYHFDSGMLGQFLAETAVARGVEHVQGKVADVLRGESGNIAGLALADGRHVEADFFVDSTGFRSLLMQQALGVRFRSFEENLFNDSAVVLPTPQGEAPACQTVSTALKYGWAWNIPLTNRIGNGYVYSSGFCTADEAETELREALDLLDSEVEARHLKMKVGQVEKHWHRNCHAVGLSQGFIEPLEATALHVVQTTIEGFMKNWEAGGFTNRFEDDFNRAIGQRFEGIRDYIVCHYRVNSRDDTDYWRANASNVNHSESLQRLLRTWKDRGDLTAEIIRQGISKYYDTISWHCLLAGYGLFPPHESLQPAGAGHRGHDMTRIKDFIARCALNFRPHSEQLEFAPTELRGPAVGPPAGSC